MTTVTTVAFRSRRPSCWASGVTGSGETVRTRSATDPLSDRVVTISPRPVTFMDGPETRFVRGEAMSATGVTGVTGDSIGGSR